jgi:hypothetical protein
MKFKRHVRYQVEYETEVEVEIDMDDFHRSGLTLEEYVEGNLEEYFCDAYGDINIPAGSDQEYCENSFEIVSERDLPQPPALRQLAEQAE